MASITPDMCNIKFTGARPQYKVRSDDFPVLSKLAATLDVQPIFDPILTISFSSGHMASRPTIPASDMVYRLTMMYICISEAEKSTLEAWESAIHINRDIFELIYPATEDIWEVYLEDEILFIPNAGNPITYNMNCVFIGALKE